MSAMKIQSAYAGARSERGTAYTSEYRAYGTVQNKYRTYGTFPLTYTLHTIPNKYRTYGTFHKKYRAYGTFPLTYTLDTTYPTNTGHTVLFIQITGRTVLFISFTLHTAH